MCLNEKNVNFVQFLHEISVEHQFEVTYVDIEEKTYSGHCQCLVQLSTLPVAVCQGSGKTSKDVSIDFFILILGSCTNSCAFLSTRPKPMQLKMLWNI